MCEPDDEHLGRIEQRLREAIAVQRAVLSSLEMNLAIVVKRRGGAIGAPGETLSAGELATLRSFCNTCATPNEDLLLV